MNLWCVKSRSFTLVPRAAPAAGLYCPARAGYGQSIACIMATETLSSDQRMVFDPKKRDIQAV